MPQMGFAIGTVIEGVSFSLKDRLDIIEAMGTQLTSVRASGGGARSLFWRQMLADIFDKRVVTLETQEGSAYGAALLSMVGTGAYATVPEVCAAAIHEVDTIAPRPAEVVPYARQHQLFQSLYPALKPYFTAVASAEAAGAGRA